MKELNISNYPLPALVDDEDWDRLSQFKWHVTSEKSFSIVRMVNKNYKTKSVSIANEVMKDYSSMFDHKDGQHLNNQKSNLRVCTHSQNNANKPKYNLKRQSSSKYKGVSWHKVTSKWCAYINCNGYRKNLGLFENEDDAARAYDTAAIELFKEFANLNFK